MHRPSNRSPRSLVAVASALAFSVLAASAFATTTTSTGPGAPSSLWSTPANWSPTTADPNNGNAGVSDYDVIIAAPSPTLLDTTVTIDTLTVNATGNLKINGGQTL